MLDFITNLFRRKQQEPLPTLADPFFGTLVYFPSAGIWSGAIRFAPVGRDLEILIEAGASGPGETHRAFFNELATRWPEIQTAIAEILFPPMKKWAKRDYDENNPWVSFELRGVRIPSLTTEPAEWTISYWCPSAKHHFDIQMTNWTPDGLDISRK